MTQDKPAVSQGDEFIISRVFDAPRDLVWKAFTQAEHLKHWWGPKGFTARVLKLDLRPGGIFHYRLQGPDGQVVWGKFIYREIVAPERIVHTVSFSDENLGLTKHPMSPDWPMEMLSTVTFADEGGKTRMTVRWTPLDPTEVERHTFATSHADMQQGWGGTMDQLADHLERAHST